MLEMWINLDLDHIFYCVKIKNQKKKKKKKKNNQTNKQTKNKTKPKTTNQPTKQTNKQKTNWELKTCIIIYICTCICASDACKLH